MKTLQVKIITEDFINASRFDSPEKCPLANALNRMHSDMGIWRVGVYTATSKKGSEFPKIWKIPHNEGVCWGNRHVDDNRYHPDLIDRMIMLAKQGAEVETVEIEVVELT